MADAMCFARNEFHALPSNVTPDDNEMVLRYLRAHRSASAASIPIGPNQATAEAAAAEASPADEPKAPAPAAEREAADKR